MIVNNNQDPVAWAFYNEDGGIRFIIHDKDRMELWSKAHNGDIVPLYSNDSNSRDSNSMVE
jgi:hypothetical protein